MFHRRWIYDLLSFNSYLLSPIRTKHNPPLAPMTNGGLTSRLDCSIFLPLAFLDLPFGCWGIGELWGLPIHKTHFTRRRLLWLLPKPDSRVAHHREVCFVFGVFRSFACFFEEFLGFRTVQGFGNLLSSSAHWTHSFPVSIMYNRSVYLSTLFMHFFYFSQIQIQRQSISHKSLCRQQLSSARNLSIESRGSSQKAAWRASRSS